MKISKFLLLVFTIIPTTAAISDNRMSVEAISSAISWVKPSLAQNKITSYARAISKAAHQYKVDPLTLVAIAHQESSFRENLPMGKAGELGLLQIRRQWIQNGRFRKEFKNVQEQDLKNPEKAFTYAAWILFDLKKSSRSKKLPYWTFYNARKFENRLKYFLRVKRHLTAIDTKRERSKAITVAVKASTSPEPVVQRAISEMLPRDYLNQINWYQKAVDVIREQES
ncbi:MAG: transglycosylase SLT domain-containing protein [Pseudomonadota bacterium]